RCALTFKGLEYQIQWLEYPDIETTAKQIGAPPTSTWASDGSPRYTIPFIHDSKTAKVFSDSLKIVEYLDETYPKTVRLIPNGTKALQSVFADSFWTVYANDINPIAGMHLPNRWFTPRNAEYYLKWAPPKSAGQLAMKEKDVKEAWEKFKNRLGELDKTIGEGNNFVMGNRVSFADCGLIAWLMLLRFVWDDETEEWKSVMEWHGGRWKRLIAAYEDLRDGKQSLSPSLD
ncbi:hypothetical protein K435DRAFT_698044, partial [Dendrothele bispora CBS 962.96]